MFFGIQIFHGNVSMMLFRPEPGLSMRQAWLPVDRRDRSTLKQAGFELRRWRLDTFGVQHTRYEFILL